MAIGGDADTIVWWQMVCRGVLTYAVNVSVI